MNLSPIFETDKQYTISELQEIFGVSSSQTIRNWIDKGHLTENWKTRNGQEVRYFKGHELMRDVENSDHLQKKLREAHMAENDEDENDYVQSLEETVSELQARLEEVTEERDTLKNESMEIISKLVGTIESQNDRIESLESTVENRLPEPEEDDEDSGWFSW